MSERADEHYTPLELFVAGFRAGMEHAATMIPDDGPWDEVQYRARYSEPAAHEAFQEVYSEGTTHAGPGLTAAPLRRIRALFPDPDADSMLVLGMLETEEFAAYGKPEHERTIRDLANRITAVAALANAAPEKESL